MSAIVIKEGLVHYEVIGRGRPLLFIHGWFGSWRYWVPAMEELSRNYRTYAFDLWGFGDSDKMRSYYSLEAYVEQLREFMDQLGIWSIPIVGHSLGGVVALLFATQFPDRVEQVMGVSVPLIGEDVDRSLTSFSGNGAALARLAARRADFPEVNMEVQKTDAEAVTHSVRSAVEQDLHRLLPPIEIPVLLLYGSEDSIVQLSQPEWLQDCDDNVRSFYLGNVQHFPMLEEQNKFNRLLMDFLDSGDDLSSLELKEEWQRRLR